MTKKMKVTIENLSKDLNVSSDVVSIIAGRWTSLLFVMIVERDDVSKARANLDNPMRSDRKRYRHKIGGLKSIKFRLWIFEGCATFSPQLNNASQSNSQCRTTCPLSLLQ
jgi:hypothetical protein